MDDVKIKEKKRFWGAVFFTKSGRFCVVCVCVRDKLFEIGDVTQFPRKKNLFLLVSFSCDTV